jgi:hypothetical protein
MKECSVGFGKHLCQLMAVEGFACVFACRAARRKGRSHHCGTGIFGWRFRRVTTRLVYSESQFRLQPVRGKGLSRLE